MSYEEEYTDIKLPKKAYDKIVIAVTKLFVELGIGTYPIDPFEIIKRKGYILRTYSKLSVQKQRALKAKDLDATSFYDPSLKAIVIYFDETQPIERIRFTLMHEVGHIVLGHKEESDLAKKMADYFAAYSLAPFPIILKFHCEDYLEVASIFGISSECAYYTFNRYRKWYEFGGRTKDHEKTLIALFESINNLEERGDAS
ncbi:MAG: ImmA/IrrE family metallo-endopeptidase [Clostridiales bacterium]|nr:ImmA/IrrE family metallo-endopeptidase [Clostridiales bacterium]